MTRTPRRRPSLYELWRRRRRRILSFIRIVVYLLQKFTCAASSPRRHHTSSSFVYNKKKVKKVRARPRARDDSAKTQGGVPATTAETTLSPRPVPRAAVPPNIPAIGLTPVLLVYTNPNANPDASAALANASWYRTSADMVGSLTQKASVVCSVSCTNDVCFRRR